MNAQLTILKGTETLFNREADSVETLLLKASPLFRNRDQYVIECSYINDAIAEFITIFEIAKVIKCSKGTKKAMKKLQKNDCYVVIDTISDDIKESENSELQRALNLPISEVINLFSD